MAVEIEKDCKEYMIFSNKWNTFLLIYTYLYMYISYHKRNLIP